MTTGTDTYRRELVQALRAGNVPPERIGEIVAEVESHVADTGEHPREAFGPAREYAAGFTRPSSTRGRFSFWVVMALSATSGWLISRGAFGLVDSEPVHGMPAWTALLVGVLLWTPAVLAQTRRNAPVPDPRDGRPPMTPSARSVALGMTVFLAVLGAASWLLAVLTS